MPLTLLLAFLEGFILILSPCILPLIPLMFASGISQEKKRPLGLFLGFVLSFALFGLFSRAIVRTTGLDLNWVRLLSYALLASFGMILLSSTLSQLFSQLTQRFAAIAASLFSKQRQSTGFGSGLFLGCLIALVWTPCAGPILAAVIVQTVLQQTSWQSFWLLFAFALGVALPLMMIMVYGSKLLLSFKIQALSLRRMLGLIILASVAYMIYIEQGPGFSIYSPTAQKPATSLEDGLWQPYPAPEIHGIDAWLNSSPLKLSTLQGKVVLIDFWTYSCINCLRTLPYLKHWDKQYRAKGLVIIGVHTPEFDFEKKLDNVQNAVKRAQITYPIALDNQFQTWRAYDNHYWPAHYLINKEGKVVYVHYGEGDYEIMDNNIRYLLGMRGLPATTPQGIETTAYFQTPETYLGYARANILAAPTLKHDELASYQFPENLDPDAWALQGAWLVNADKVIAMADKAALKIHFRGHKVFVVVGNDEGEPQQLKLLLNGKPISQSAEGKDVHESKLVVDKSGIYELLAGGEGQGILELIVEAPGLAFYTFTF